MKRISKRIRSTAGKVMSSEDGYEVRDAIASALVDVGDAMEDYERPKRMMCRNCILCVLIGTCISVASLILSVVMFIACIWIL